MSSMEIQSAHSTNRGNGIQEQSGDTPKPPQSKRLGVVQPRPHPLSSTKNKLHDQDVNSETKVLSLDKNAPRCQKEKAERANLASISEGKETEKEIEVFLTEEAEDKNEGKEKKDKSGKSEVNKGLSALKRLMERKKSSNNENGSQPGHIVARKLSWLKAYKSAKCDRKLNMSTKNSEIEDVIINLLSENGNVSVAKFWNAIKATGLYPEDPRLRECRANFKRMRLQLNPDYLEEHDFHVDKDTFKKCISENIWVVGRAFKKDLIIPEFHGFGHQIENIFLKCKENASGQVPDNIPHLARVDPDLWSVCVCTTDGQRGSFGDSKTAYCLQASSMPINYALAVSELGAKEVHKWVGFEPSGGAYNDLSLNHNDKPHNPMVNAGALVTLSLLKRGSSPADRFDYLFRSYKKLAGGEYVGFNNSVYLSEKESADRNFAIAYYLSENKCMPAESKLIQTLELLFQVCSIEVTPESGAVMAATLANGGICPITGERVLATEAVRNTLSLMHSCGMYDYSGHFAFKVGLPAKSGIGGSILLVVPRVMGVCCYSPTLDHNGNSVKGIQFCEEMVKVFNFHNYDILSDGSDKNDPRIKTTDNKPTSVVNLLFGAAKGDVATIRRFALSGMDMSSKDYDGRTALHVAAAEGHLAIVRMLIEKCRVHPDIKDRWGHLPLDDARLFGHNNVVSYLEEHHEYIQKVQTRRLSVASFNDIPPELSLQLALKCES